MKKSCILLVEDSQEITDLIISILQEECALFCAQDITSATSFLEKHTFDLILLDVNLPDGNGFHFCSKVLNSRKHGETSVVFLTAHGSTDDKVMGYTLGAEDYIVKPIDPQVFRAQIKRKLKTKDRNKFAEIIEKRCLKIDLRRQKVSILDGNKPRKIELTPTEFSLLTTLIGREEEILSRNQLIDFVWGVDKNITDRVVDMNISSLRRKLGKERDLIQTVYGVGYRFSLENSLKKTS